MAVLHPAEGSVSVASVSPALAFLVDGAEREGLLGALQLSHLDSVFLSPSQPFHPLLMAPGPELPSAVLFTVTFHCVSKLAAVGLLLFGSGGRENYPVSCRHAGPE